MNTVKVTFKNGEIETFSKVVSLIFYNKRCTIGTRIKTRVTNKTINLKEAELIQLF